MDQSVAFYRQVLGLRVVMDFGTNKTLTGGLSLQTRETYWDFIGTDAISFGGNDFEIYFEDLTPEAQKRYLEFMKVKSAKDLNMDMPGVFPITIIEY